MKTIAVTSVFDCMSGNSGLTEEFIYTKLATEGTAYEVLSSSTTGMTRLGFIPMCVLDNGKMLRVFEGKHGILVARNGKAGQMTYLKPSNYTVNDHAYILSLRDDFKKATDMRHLMMSDIFYYGSSALFNKRAFRLPQRLLTLLGTSPTF